MGLDGIELILAIEDAFQIHIADEEAGNVSTVGDLHSLVLSKLDARDAKRYLTSAAFYRTRRGIIDTLGIERREIRPSTLLAVILPRSNRCENWRRIQEAMKLKLPDLRHPGWIQLGLIAAGVALAVATGLYSGASYKWISLLFILGLVVGGFAIKLSPSLAVAFPNRNVTVGDLARDVLAINYAHLASEIGSSNKNDVWEALCRVIVLQTGVAPDKITPQARIVGDLGID